MSKTNPLRDKINLRLQQIREAPARMLAAIKRHLPGRVMHTVPSSVAYAESGVVTVHIGDLAPGQEARFSVNTESDVVRIKINQIAPGEKVCFTDGSESCVVRVLPAGKEQA